MDVFQYLAGVAAGQDGVVHRDQARIAGLARYDVENLCRSGRWRRLSPGTFYINANGTDQVPRRALIRAAVLSLGPAAVAVLQSAAELHGLAGMRSTDEIHVSVPAHSVTDRKARDPRVTVHQLTVAPRDVTRVAGIRTTNPTHTAAGLLLRVDRLSAVSMLDSGLHLGLLSASAIASIPALIRGRRGAVAARRYLAEADGRAQSPLETRLRLRCSDGRVPPEDLQHVVRDADGYILGVADLAWYRQARLIAEADGAGPHATPAALYEDRRRQNRITNAGWRVLRFTWSDTVRPDYIPYVVREAIRPSHAA